MITVIKVKYRINKAFFSKKSVKNKFLEAKKNNKNDAATLKSFACQNKT